MSMDTALRLLATVGRRYPFYSGNFLIVNSPRMRAILGKATGLSWCPAPGGKMLVRVDDAVGRCIFFTGDYDRKITWLCRKLLRQGDVALDIGANLGLVTLTMARCVGEAGAVHAFEPNPVLQALIEESLVRNDYRNVRLHKIALGRERGELVLNVPRENLGQGSLRYHSQNEDADRYKCAVEPLSEVLKREQIDRVRLVKVDVEGFESDVFMGARHLLETIRPDVIVFETNDPDQPRFNERAVVRVIRQFDYKFMAIPRSLVRMSLKEFNPDEVVAPSHDTISVPAEKYGEIARTLS